MAYVDIIPTDGVPEARNTKETAHVEMRFRGVMVDVTIRYRTDGSAEIGYELFRKECAKYERDQVTGLNPHGKEPMSEIKWAIALLQYARPMLGEYWTTLGVRVAGRMTVCVGNMGRDDL